LFGVYDKNLFSACDLQWLSGISGEEKALAKGANAESYNNGEKMPPG
jgi:cytochrome b subunit of formate dehydrogenase